MANNFANFQAAFPQGNQQRTGHSDRHRHREERRKKIYRVQPTHRDTDTQHTMMIAMRLHSYSSHIRLFVYVFFLLPVNAAPMTMGSFTLKEHTTDTRHIPAGPHITQSRELTNITPSYPLLCVVLSSPSAQ